MEIKFKKLHENAVLPSYAKYGDAGLDFVATEIYYDPTERATIVKSGVAMEIPYGYAGLLLSRSSISKKGVFLSNCVGVIDSGYRGEIIAKFKSITNYVSTVFNDNDYDSSVVINQLLSEKGILQVYKTAEDIYRGETEEIKSYKVGEKCFQMIILPIPRIKPIFVEELSNSERGEGGYGSTGE